MTEMDDITEMGGGGVFGGDEPEATVLAKAAWWVNGAEYVLATIPFALILVITIVLIAWALFNAEFTIAGRVVMYVALPIAYLGLIWNARRQSHDALTKCIAAGTC